MNNLIVVPPQQVQKYLHLSLSLFLKRQITQKLSKQQKIIVSKIYKNIITLCKMPKKQVIEAIKNQPVYQQAIAQLYFEKHINNTILLSGQSINKQQIICQKIDSNECVGMQYRIQFTLSTINHKQVMKPLILLKFLLKSGESIEAYFTIQMFDNLRKQIALRLKDIYTIQMKTF